MARGQEYVLCDAGSTLRTRVAAGKKVHDTWCKRSSRWDRMGQDGTKQQACIFPHLEPFFFPRNILFQLLHFPPPYFLSLREKKASLWGGPKNVIPGGSIYYLKHKHTIRSGFVAVSVSSLYTTWYRVVSVVNASICLSINNVHRCQMIFNCSCHR